MIEFADIVFNYHRKVMRPAHQLRGLARPLKAARIDRINSFVTELSCYLLRLANTHFV